MPKSSKQRNATADSGDSREINPRGVYSFSDCMKILRVGRSTLARYRQERGLPLSPIGPGVITGRSLLKWIEEQKHAPSRRGRKPAVLAAKS